MSKPEQRLKRAQAAHFPDAELLDEVDVIVVGGGFPGVCAALAAARIGAKTALLERDGVLGGQAAVVPTWGMDGFVNTKGKQLIRGIPWEILQRTIAEGQSDPFWSRADLKLMEREGVEEALTSMGLGLFASYVQNPEPFLGPLNDQYIDVNAYRYVCHTLLESEDILILLEAPVVGVLLDQNTLKGVILQSNYGLSAMECKVIVDTTPQALVAALAGHSFAHPAGYMGSHARMSGVNMERLIRYMRETPDQWQVRPLKGTVDADTVAGLVKEGNPLYLHGFQTALKTAVSENPVYNILQQDVEGGPALVSFFYTGDGCGNYFIRGKDWRQVSWEEPVRFSRGIIAGRKQQWLTHKFFREYVPGFEKAHLMETFPHIARALSISKEAGGFTEYEVTQDEIEQGCNGRNDNIARIMGHPYRGQSADGWLLPYPSLIPRGLSGLLVTGKPACRFIHYQVTCAAIGQAAGIAAAVAAQDITPLRQLDVSRIQNLLKQQGLGYK